MRALVGALLLSIHALGASAQETYQTVGVVLRIEQENDQCLVVAVGADSVPRKMALDIPAPCAFHRDTAGAVRTFSRNGVTIALLEHSMKRTDGLSGCRTRLQPIELGAAGEISKKPVRRVAACPPFQWDQKVFVAD
jgi:hypothetical protein